MKMHKKFVTTVAVAFLLFSILSVWRFPSVKATTIFSDGFESGDFSAWTGTTGTPTIVTNPVHHGSYAMKVTTVFDNYVNVYKSLNNLVTSFHRFYIRFDNTPPSVWIMYLGSSVSWDVCEVRVFNDTGTLKWHLRQRDNGGNWYDFYSTEPTIQTNTWYCIEVKWVAANPGEVRLYIDGVERLSSTTYNTGLETINRLTLGVYTASTITHNYYFDCVVVADTGPIGSEAPEAGLSVELVSPGTGSKTTLGNVTFKYTPLSINAGAIANASLWMNVSGTWQRVGWNTTAVVNNTQNMFYYNFTEAGTYLWNVQIFNSTHSVFAPSNYTLKVISPPTNISAPITQLSEIRGVFIHEAIYSVSHDWTLIAETLASYGITDVFVNDQCSTGRRHDSDISEAISAFHSFGIRYHSSMNVLGESLSDPEFRMVKSNGEAYNSYWICPIKAHDLILNNLHDYLTNHSDVDGIMLDYIRYDSDNVCYCDDCRAAFQEWLGEGTITDWTPFYPEGERWTEYAEWRTLPVTQVVKDIHDMVKSFNPNITISEAAWTLFSDIANYWRKWLGQDTAYWIKEGYIDFVAPMMYTNTIYGSTGETLQSFINAVIKYWMGGQTEGKIPVLAFLNEEYVAPTTFAEEINYVRSRGLDGWIIWRYSGPGGYLDTTYNTTDYLDEINLPPVFGIDNITVETTANSATITWTTNLMSTSKVEYCTSPLYSAVWTTQSGFHFWNITRNPSILSESNNSYVTLHSITLTGLSNGTYYYRVQSANENGTATSFPSTFVIGEESAVNWWQFTFNHKDLDGNTIDSAVTWQLYNGTQLLSYTKGQYSIRDGTYTLKTYFRGVLINQTTLYTATHGNKTININLPIKAHAAFSRGHIAFNHTITSLTINSQTTTNLTFTATGSGTYTIIISGAPRNATSVKKNGVEQPYGSVWTWNPNTQCIIIESSLSTWEVLLPSSQSPPSPPPSPPSPPPSPPGTPSPDLVSAFLPLLLTLAMLSVCLSFIKKIAE